MKPTLCALISLFLAISCPAATITVDDDGPADFDNIQAAINAAVNDDVIIVADGTYTGNGNRDIDFLGKAITVQSTDPNDPNVVAATVIDCEGSSSDKHRGFRFYCGEGPNSVVDGLTIINGDAPAEQVGTSTRDVGGAIACDGSSPTIRRCVISNNCARINSAGGGIFCQNGSNAKIEYCTVINNEAQWGGGIWGDDSSLIIRNCTIKANSTYNGGGGGLWIDGAISIDNCVIEGNISESAGGGIDLGGSSQGMINNCIILNNTAGYPSFGGYGGGINCMITNNVMVAHCTIVGNSAIASGSDPIIPIGYGGGLYSGNNDTVVVKNCIFWDNTASNGDPQISGGSLTVSYSDVEGGWGGTGNIAADPRFATGYFGDYYLSQIAAGQAVDSPCVDTGSDTAVTLGMNMLTTRTDHACDSSVVDMGYHYQMISLPEPKDCDMDGNFFVDLFDFAILASQWLQESSGLSADIFPVDGDEIVDTDDLDWLTAYWLNCVVGKAGNPDPCNSSYFDPNGIFIWSAGDGADSHDVYLGDDYNDVKNATVISGEYQDNVDFNTFDPCGIDVNTAYFWRIDEVGPACTKKGDVWGFTTRLGLVAWWEFEEGGGTDANDSAASNHGTLYGDPCWVAGKIGDWALDFNGVSDYVEVSDDPSLRFSQYDSFSISFWAKPVSEGYLLSKMRASGQSDVFGYQIKWSGSANRFNFSLEKSSVSTVTISTPDDSAIAGSWYFVTVVYDNKDMKIYLDGAIEDSGTFTEDTSSTTPDKALAIGARSYDSTVTSYYGGSIDEVRIYDRALTEPEIEQLYQAGTN